MISRRKKKISILSPTLTDNAVGRAYLLAKLLQDDYAVHIIGPGSVDNLWHPLRDDPSVEYRSFDCNRLQDLMTPVVADRLIDGDLIYAVKPLLSSFGLGLMAKMKLRRPLLLDIDDWEIGFLLTKWHWELQKGVLPWLTAIKSPLFTRLLDRLTWFADGITVSTSFLQHRYGGCWIPHARDERLFQNNAEPESVNNELTVLFLGTPRAHKGLEELLGAWAMVRNPEARLRIVGFAEGSEESRKIIGLADNRVNFEDPVPFSSVPAIIRSSSIVVIPQLSERASVGQLPAKLIDAMAAGKPIISTSVGDIPKWLANRSGIVVPPGDICALAHAINMLLCSPDKSSELGYNAKNRYLKYGSFKTNQPKLIRYIEDILSGVKPSVKSLTLVDNELGINTL